MPRETFRQNELNAEPRLAHGITLHEYQPLRGTADGYVHGEQAAVQATYPELQGKGLMRCWNDVLAVLSYGPNAEAGNFERVSFDLAPTLAQYLEEYHPETYQRIIAAPSNVEAAGNPANVLGTPYFHAIMPLLPEYDQHTLLQWGRYDTERRFGVEPEGLWLPEMAMDEQTLAVAHEHGYEWTHGFPHQLKGMVGTPTAYNVSLGNNRSMRILRESSHDSSSWHEFYNGTHERFYSKAPNRAVQNVPYQMIAKATDGEHIQREFDKNSKPKAGGMVERLRSVPEYQTDEVSWMHPTTFMYELKDKNVELPHAELAGTIAGEGTFDSRMARTHGLDRWTGEVDGEITVPWKRELQKAYRDFSDRMDQVYEVAMETLGAEKPWEMRDDYIRLLEGEVDEREFFNIWDPGENLNGEKRQQALKLLASQYHKLAASTSCGWFFDKPSGPEPKIVVRQMRIALEHVRTSNIAGIPTKSDSGTTVFGFETNTSDSETVNGEQLADAIEDQLLDQLYEAADKKARLNRVYKRIGVASVRSLTLPPQYR